MADYSAYGPWVGGDDWRAWVGVYVTSNTDTAVTFRVESWAWSQYGTTSGYDNIRGGVAYGNNAWDRGSATSISQNSWKKLYEKSYTVTKTHVAQSVKCWALAEGISGTYSGSSSTATVNITIGAKRSYAITYNANGHGTAPAAQTKWTGEALQLRGAITATGYTFKGWNTYAGGGGTAYAASGTYTANAAATLYAQWQASYSAPKITAPKVLRCDSSGTSDDEGTYALLELSWSVDTTSSGALATNGLTVKWRERGTTTWGTAVVLASGGTSGTVSEVLGSGGFSVNKSYELMLTATDTHGLSTAQSLVLSPAFFTLDFLAGGRGVAVGKAATRAGLDIAMLMYLANGAYIYSEKTDSAVRQLIGLNASNQLVIGYGGYANSDVDTYIEGNNVELRAQGEVRLRGSANVAVDYAPTDWAYLVGSASGNRVRYCKRGGAVFVEVWYESGAGVGTSATTLGTLPAGFRPSLQIETCAFGNANNVAMLRVNPGGSIVARSMSGTMNYFKGVISFPI